MSLWTLTLADFQRELASGAPTPGGGAAACVCGVLGLGLVNMALEISAPASSRGAAPAATAAPAPEAGQRRELAQVLADVRALAIELQVHADRDVAAFNHYMSARKLPRESPGERATRELALREASLAAARAPLEAARDLVRALELALAAAPLVKATLASDVLGGADLLNGALAAALRTVEINLPAVGDAALRAQLDAERQSLSQSARAVHARIEAHWAAV
jgi:formiminotetrahydrofolate cyclodeaminase